MDPYRSIVGAPTTLCRSGPKRASTRHLSDVVRPRDHAATGHNITILTGTDQAHQSDASSTACKLYYKWITRECFLCPTPSARFSRTLSFDSWFCLLRIRFILPLAPNNEIKHPLRRRPPSHLRNLNSNRQTSRRAQRLRLQKQNPPKPRRPPPRPRRNLLRRHQHPRTLPAIPRLLHL